jgi:hypothetical protein
MPQNYGMEKSNKNSLPDPAKEILRRAARATYRNEFERTRAIDAAIAQVRRLYPDYFKEGE